MVIGRFARAVFLITRLDERDTLAGGRGSPASAGDLGPPFWLSNVSHIGFSHRSGDRPLMMPTGLGGHLLPISAKLWRKLGKDLGGPVTVELLERLTERRLWLVSADAVTEHRDALPFEVETVGCPPGYCHDEREGVPAHQVTLPNNETGVGGF
jgi:hypothetical protein